MAGNFLITAFLGMLALISVQQTKSDLPKGARQLPGEILEEYQGAYEMFPGMLIVISLDGDQLFAQPTGQEKAPMYASADEVPDFFFLVVPKADVRAEILFKRDDSGKITGLTIIQNFEEAEGVKLPVESR